MGWSRQGRKTERQEGGLPGGKNTPKSCLLTKTFGDNNKKGSRYFRRVPDEYNDDNKYKNNINKFQREKKPGKMSELK